MGCSCDEKVSRKNAYCIWPCQGNCVWSQCLVTMEHLNLSFSGFIGYGCFKRWTLAMKALSSPCWDRAKLTIGTHALAIPKHELRCISGVCFITGVLGIQARHHFRSSARRIERCSWRFKGWTFEAPITSSINNYYKSNFGLVTEKVKMWRLLMLFQGLDGIHCLYSAA